VRRLDFAEASRPMDKVQVPYRRASDLPVTKINVVYGDGHGSFEGCARTFRRSGYWKPWPNDLRPLRVAVAIVTFQLIRPPSLALRLPGEVKRLRTMCGCPLCLARLKERK
jgi:hypothetical protein